MPREGWKRMLEESGFVSVEIGPPVDTPVSDCEMPPVFTVPFGELSCFQLNSDWPGRA